jgi:hypothetical protein
MDQSRARAVVVTKHQQQLIELLARAKRARTEEERAHFFRIAEEWSQRASEADDPGCDNEILTKAGLWRDIVDYSVSKGSC